MAQHTRTRTGCWTCREAGYKCDERKPFCDRCTRLKIACKGYGPKFKWKNTTAGTVPAKRPRKNMEGKNRTESQSSTSPTSTCSGTSGPFNATISSKRMTSPQDAVYSSVSLSASSPDSMPDLSSDDKSLLYYWNQRLSFLVSVAPRRGWPNSFHLHLHSMICEPGALRSTILSIAANHLSIMLNNPVIQLQGFRHQQHAIRSLQHLIQSQSDKDIEPALATVMMMQISARLFTSDEVGEQAGNHLLGARAIIARRGRENLWRTSSTANFLLNLFAYHDIISSMSRCTRTLIDHGEGFSAIEGIGNMQSLAKVLQIVARISELQDMAKLGASPAHDDFELAGRFYDTGYNINKALQDLDFTPQMTSYSESPEDRDIRLTAETYRHAAFIYLYRIWLNFGAPHPMTVHHVQAIVSILRQIPEDSFIVSAHIWPLWTGGCESMNMEDRMFARNRLQKMYKSRLFPSLKRVVSDMEKVWAKKDSERAVSGDEGMTKVDCITVVRELQGREVDLA